MALSNGDYLPLTSPEDNDREETERRTSSVSKHFVVLLAGVAAFASIANFVAQSQPQDTTPRSAGQKSMNVLRETSNNPMEFIASNEYGESNVGQEYPWINGKVVVEPYRETTLTLTVDLQDSEKLRWVIEGVDEVIYGTEAVFTLEETGTYSVTLSKVSEAGAVLATYTSEIICLYGE